MSDVSTGGGDQDGAYKSDVTINNGYIPNWRYLSNSEKNKVIDKRNKQGLKVGDEKGSNNTNELDKIKYLKKKNSKLKRNIKALKKKVTNDNDEGDDNDEPRYAGDQFGRKQSNKNSKKN